MRIVCMADTHQFHHELTVPAGDLLVHAGDFCRRGDLGECQQFADWWNYLPHRHKVLVPGNHEFCFQKQCARAEGLFPGTHCLLDAEVTLDGARIYGSPWQPRYLDWAFNLPRGEALAARWARIPAGLHLLVTHGPPHGTGDRTSHSERGHRGGVHSGCEAVVVPEPSPDQARFSHLTRLDLSNIATAEQLDGNAAWSGEFEWKEIQQRRRRGRSA